MPSHDVNPRGVLWGGLAIAAAVAVAVLAVFALLRRWHVPPGADRVRHPYDLIIDGPVLQSAPQLDLAAYRAEKQRELDASGWVDAQRGIVRVPVATAMEALAASAAASRPGRGR